MTLLDDLAFHRGTAEELLLAGIDHRGPGPFVVTTVNVQHVALAARDDGFAEVLRRSDAVTADGAPVSWVARRRSLAGTRVTGAELVDLLVNRPPRPGVRVYLFGTDLETLRDAAARIVRSGGIVAGYDAPSRAELEDGERSLELARRIAATGPDVVVLFLGAPLQERWAHRYREAIGPAVIIGAGGALAFATGRARRCPAFLQRLGLEWAYRLASEPRRLWRRYLVEYWPGLLSLAREAAAR